MERMEGATENKESKRFSAFLERIGRQDLESKITPETPWAYYTMEMYGGGVKGEGGLGILAADTYETAKKIGMPAIFYTLFYPRESKQVISANFSEKDKSINFSQNIVTETVSPESIEFEKTGKTSVFSTIGGAFSATELNVHERREGNTKLVLLTEQNLGGRYEGAEDSDHRLYQQIVLGFGGYKDSKQRKIKPPVTQLNESASVFAALGELDDILKKDGEFDKALAKIRDKTIYTNHTVVPAADATFSRDQYERFVMPNIESEELKKWLRGMINSFGGALRLNMLAMVLAGKKNGVSKRHAEEASMVYRDHERKQVEFEAVTNGISMERWIDEEILSLYCESGIIDEFDLPTADYEAKIDAWDPDTPRSLKKRLRENAREFLKTRINQYDQPVEIPSKSIIFDWSRRIAEYKRPGMVFENPNKLARLLETKDAYLIMAGKAHQSDGPMHGEISRILKIVDRNPILKKRVHFVENYDADLAKALAEGADISINTPVVKDRSGHNISMEACATSWMKKIGNATLLISTSDGGVADPEVEARQKGIEDFEPPYFKISGKTYEKYEEEEVASLYERMGEAADIVRKKNPEEWADAVKRQLKAYLPIISGARMIKDYLNLAFPLAEASK